MRVGEDDVRRVAELANLALTQEEIARMARDLTGILEHVDKLTELDTSNVEPMAQVLSDSSVDVLREDRTRPTLTNAEALANAPIAGGGYFKAPKVLER